jgi:hypothetical protein
MKNVNEVMKSILNKLIQNPKQELKDKFIPQLKQSVKQQKLVHNLTLISYYVSEHLKEFNRKQKIEHLKHILDYVQYYHFHQSLLKQTNKNSMNSSSSSTSNKNNSSSIHLNVNVNNNSNKNNNNNNNNSNSLINFKNSFMKNSNEKLELCVMTVGEVIEKFLKFISNELFYDFQYEIFPINCKLLVFNFLIIEKFISYSSDFNPFTKSPFMSKII